MTTEPMDSWVLDGREPRLATSVEEWVRLNRIGNRRVAHTEIGVVTVSTVFLGVDHRWGDEGPPLLFETMVFGGPLDGKQ